MSYSGRLLLFLAISLIVLLIYAGLNFFVTSHVEEVVSRAPAIPEGMGENLANAACERARDRYDTLLDNVPDDGNFEARDRQVDFALAEIDRACG